MIMKLLPLALSVGSIVPAAVVGGLLAVRAPAPAAEANLRSSVVTERTLTVSGEAQIHVVPDKATFTVIVDAVDKDKTKAQQLVQQKTAAVIAASSKAGMTPAGITIANVGINPEYEMDRHGNPIPSRVIRWTASRTLTFCVSELSHMNEVFGAVIDAGGSVEGAVTFDTSRLEELRTEARKLAAAAARKKADVLVHALGGAVGLPRTINDEDPSWSGPVSYKNAVESWQNGAFVDGAFASGQMTLAAHVNVVFDVDHG